MNVGIGSSHAPTYLSTVSSTNKSSGEKPIEDRGSLVKPVEQTSESPKMNSSTQADSQVLHVKQQQLQRLESQQEQLDQRQIQQLSARDREVRNHERAHAAVGGQYAGAPRYQFERGPDGINYAVGGEVSISAGGVSGNPQATIDKAQLIRRAALAPAEPSAQDRKVAAQATQMEAAARVELSTIQREERLAAQSSNIDESQSKATTDGDSAIASTGTSTSSASSEANGGFQAASISRQDQQQNAFNSPSDSLNRLITSSNANGQYTEPGQLLNQIA